MNVENNQQAHDRLADAIWWLKGFRAARNEEFDNDGVSFVINGLQDVQYFLSAEKETKPKIPGQM